jgi:hypothetical protein
MILRYLSLIFSFSVACVASAQKNPFVSIVEVANGWAGNSVNTVVFRKNSLTTYRDTQFISFYNAKGVVVLGKRKLGTKKWQLKETNFTGDIKDAHNSTSIMTDGEGYLHLTWDHHNNPLNYARSLAPLSLEMSEKIKMTGNAESSVTYPEFYRLPNGNLLFQYRDGGSGRGNLAINNYDIKTKQWRKRHSNLINGEGKRNAYWQACVDAKGVVHLSWVWRESPDVASNHDMCYAKSTDGGKTWVSSEGKKYQLPITAATAEYISLIPQKSELINQTSMFADEAGNIFIAGYWREKNDSIPQYHLAFKKNSRWQTHNLGFRKTPFSLSGGGTKRIPISRPQIIAWQSSKKINVAIIFRDEERGNKVSAAICNDIDNLQWKIIDLSKEDLGSWEPTYDTELWKEKRILNLFVQKTEQADAEGKTNIPPQMVKVLEWKPLTDHAVGRVQ